MCSEKLEKTLLNVTGCYSLNVFLHNYFFYNNTKCMYYNKLYFHFNIKRGILEYIFFFR